MDAHIKKVYVPMTETGFYILLCLRSPNHGYGIVQKVKEITDNEVILGPGTMYGSLSKMEKDGLIQFVCEEDKRKIYQITDLGTEVLELEWKRIRRLYRNAQEGWEYLMNFNGYCYFRKPMAMMQQKEEIFCDDTSRLEMMQRIFYGRIIPLIAIFCCLIINGYMSTTEHGAHRLTIVFAVLMVLYMVIFLQFAVKYFFFRQKLKK